MKWKEENLDVLQNLEFAIVEVWRAHPGMTDYSALRAYEVARQHYRDEQRGRQPKPLNLMGIDAVAFGALKKVCEFRLGRDPGPPPTPGSEVSMEAIPVEKLIACLQELAKSVERHTRLDGRQGYLKFIDQFLK